MIKYLLGIDIGTTGTKTYLFSEEGKEIAHAYRGYETFTPDTKTCEQNAREIWEAVVETVQKSCESIENKEDIAAISMSTQGGTLIPTDKYFNPVHNAIVWSDKSCDEARKQYVAGGGDISEVYKKTGWMFGCGLPLLQARRLYDEKKEIFDKTAWFLSVHDFISARLTGIPKVDMSNAGINQFADIRTGKYDKALCDFARVDEKRLPRLIKSCEVIGNLTAEAAGALGLSEKTVLVGGAHDQYAVALGAGIINTGEMLIGSGTSWVVTAIADAPDFSSGLSQSVAAVKGKWGSMLSLSYGGACLEWLRKNIIIGSDENPVSLCELDKKCENSRAAADGLFFYPFSAKNGGSNTRAVFTGLDISHDRYNMALAVMEGVAFQIKLMIEAFSTEISPNGIKLTGGAAKSTLWPQIIADILDCPVIIPAIADMACVGAAIMAGVGAGIYDTAELGCEKMIQNEKVIYPCPKKAELYKECFIKYKENSGLIEKL